MIRTHRAPPFSQPRRRRLKSRVLAADYFQRRYTLFFVAVGLFITISGGGVCWYLINHNYDILIKTSLLTAPKVVDTLERELALANQILIAAFLGLFAFLILSGIRLTHRIISPLLIIQDHMRELSRGNFLEAKARLRRTDEFLDFADSYNYLVAGLRAQTAEDLKKLMALKPDPRNVDATQIWEAMVREKKEQLGQQSNDASNDPAPASRRVS